MVIDVFWNFLKKMFTLTPVWVDRGSGRWVRRLRMHPALRALLLILLMVAGISWGLNRLAGAPVPEVLPGEPQEESIRTSSDTASLPPPEVEPQAPVPAPPLPLPLEVPVPQDVLFAEPVRLENVAKMLRPSPSKGASVFGRDDASASRTGKKSDYWVRIRKGDYTLSLYRGDALVKSYSIAVGRNPGNKQRVGDHRTPVGHFRVQSIENSQKWKHDFGDGNGMIDGAYGPWFIRLDTGWKGIGIHGTHDPDSRGSMATEGCIRMSNEEVQELSQYAYKNMKVVIEE